MAPIDTELLQRYRAATSVLRALPSDVGLYRAADEAMLLEANRLFADAQRVLGAAGTMNAGEIAHRSVPELGSQGLTNVLGSAPRKSSSAPQRGPLNARRSRR